MTASIPGFRKSFALLLLLSGSLLAVVCLGFLLKGGGYQIAGFKASNPEPRLLGMVLCLASGYLLYPGHTPQKQKTIQLILLTISTSVSLLIAEFGVRAFLQSTQGFNSLQQLHNPNPDGNLHTTSHHPLLVITRLSANKRIIYELKPDVEMSFGHRDLRISKQGLREDKVYSEKKPANTLRIVGIGDSGMWGWNVHQGEEYLARLEAALPEHTDRHVEVINFAVPGYNCFQELETLKAKALAFQPDIVILGWCENDYQLPFFMYTRKDHWATKESYIYRLALDRESFHKLAEAEVLKLGDIDTELVDPQVVEYSGWDGVERCFGEFNALAKKHGFQLLVFGPVKEQPRQLLDALQIDTYNTLEEIDKNNYPSEYSVHFMHPPKEGHQVLADHLLKALTARGWVSAP